MFYMYKGFELQGVIEQYTSVQWIRRYNDIGEFEIKIPFTKQMYSLLDIGNIVYHKKIKEACFIEDKTVQVDGYGNDILVISGKNISCILEDRIASYTGTATISTIIKSLLNSNFISPSNTNRKISELTLGNTIILNDTSISIKYENVSVFTMVKEITQQYNVGFSIVFDIENQKYIFNLYEGFEKKEVVFSKDFNNVLEQEYYFSVNGYKNTCVLDNGTVVNDENKGLARKETYTTINADSITTAKEQGNLFLQQYKEMETLDTVIDTNSMQFFYLVDWNLGDIVTTINKKIGVTIQRNIVEIEEFYDESGMNLTVSFGDYWKKGV